MVNEHSPSAEYILCKADKRQPSHLVLHLLQKSLLPHLQGDKSDILDALCANSWFVLASSPLPKATGLCHEYLRLVLVRTDV